MAASAECSHPRGTRRSTHDHRTAIFRQAAAILKAELAGSISADEVARRVASSPRQLRRAFSEIGGMSFREFLTSARMARARDMLESTDIPVKEVARRVGYHEPSQFTKAFQRADGVTPSAFRKAHRRRSPTARAAPLVATGQPAARTHPGPPRRVAVQQQERIQEEQ